MKEHISILLADDHPIVRKGMKDILAGEKGIEVVHESGDGEDALNYLREHTVNIAIVDMNMPKKNGLQVAIAASKERIPVDFVVMTMYKDELMFNRAIDAEVRGYVLKENAITEILDCVRAVTEGKLYLSPSLSEFLLRRSKHRESLPHSIQGLNDLTPTERKVLLLLAELKTNKEIADELSISIKTVTNHRDNICKKLELHGAHALLKFALENKAFL